MPTVNKVIAAKQFTANAQVHCTTHGQGASHPAQTGTAEHHNDGLAKHVLSLDHCCSYCFTHIGSFTLPELPPQSSDPAFLPFLGEIFGAGRYVPKNFLWTSLSSRGPPPSVSFLPALLQTF